MRIKEDERIAWEDAFNHSLMREEPRRNPLKNLIEREEDKENQTMNRREDEKKSVSITAKRDVSENKRNHNTTYNF